MLPKDYLAYRLSGSFCTDVSDASGMLLLDVKNRCWSKEMLEICGITEEQLPKLYESWEVVGTLKPEIAKELGADIYVHPFENYARQFNWGIDNTNITTKWTFRLDADERLTPALCKELSRLIKEHDNDEVNGITMEAYLYFMGKVMKHGGAQKRKIMLFKTGIGRVEDRKMDEHTILSAGTAVACIEKFIHHDFKDMTFWVNKLNWYATREMQDYFDYINGKEASINAKDKEIGKVRNI